ncbi:MAG: zonular occludens toxin domain-containing protein [Nanoarchaeota archaeon]|nr:zonular occludens toxin domain-containing protein [Nanoarchaeota archaeon]MBU1051351.1 zonular occludens toxin domain-containing protein [Nanoarchaeota archaeon]MBU1988612.1 zonular occludens toxin domain-containing protein [Nanoarchaeota archaeon]
MKKKKKKQRSILLEVLKSPYYAGRGIYRLGKKIKQKNVEREIQSKREKIVPEYNELRVIEKLSGNLVFWEKELLKAESKIGIILGARGSGKTAFAIKLIENIYSKQKAKCYAIGFKKEEMPSWIEVIEDVSQIKNNATVVIDEGGILFSSRKAMSKPNQLLSELILIARHKNLNILFISQNSSNLDVNIIRQADFLVLKPTSLLQKDFERKKIREIYQEVEEMFNKHGNDKGLSYIYANEFRGFVSNPLPSFWNVGISKSFRK